MKKLLNRLSLASAILAFVLLNLLLTLNLFDLLSEELAWLIGVNGAIFGMGSWLLSFAAIDY